MSSEVVSTIGTIGSIVGTGVSVIGAIKGGEASAQTANAQAKQSAENAAIVRQQAAEDERVFRAETGKALGSMRANYAASGLQIEGTPYDVLRNSAMEAELDALKIRHGGELKAMGYQTENTLAKVRESAYRTGGYLSAAGYLFGGLKNLLD